MEAALQAIAEPNRRRILEILMSSGELSSGEIASHFSQTPAAVSQHLGVLQQAHLVLVRREGARRLYRLREEGLRELRVFLESFWGRGLQRLKDAAESQAGGERRRTSGGRGTRRRRRRA